MSSFPHKFSVIQHQNLICIFDGCRTLGYQEYRCISGTFFNGSSQSRIRCKVQCGSTVVKNQNLRFPDQCPCNGQPLSLSSGKVSSTGFYFFIQPFLFLLHHFFRLRDLQVYDGFPHTPTLCVEQRVSMTRWAPECFGTCDCLLIGDGVLHVIDFKYGAGVPVSPEENTQMMLYALGAWDLFSATDDIQTVRMSIVQPRIQSEPETWEIPENNLIRWAEDFLKPMAKLAWEGKGELNPGEKQCRWCKAKAQCRAWKDKYGPLADFVCHTDPGANDPRLLTPDEIGAWLVEAQGIADYVKSLQEYAQQQLQCGTAIPGWKLVEGRSTRRFTDQDAAFKAIEADGISEAMLYERSPISLTAAEKLLGKKRFAEVCGTWVEKPKGKPTLAPESDKRPAYDAAEGFEVIK